MSPHWIGCNKNAHCLTLNGSYQCNIDSQEHQVKFEQKQIRRWVLVLLFCGHTGNKMSALHTLIVFDVFDSDYEHTICDVCLALLLKKCWRHFLSFSARVSFLTATVNESVPSEELSFLWP